MSSISERYRAVICPLTLYLHSIFTNSICQRCIVNFVELLFKLYDFKNNFICEKFLSIHLLVHNDEFFNSS